MSTRPIRFAIAALLAAVAVNASARLGAEPTAAERPQVLLWGSKDIADVPGGAGELYRDRARGDNRIDHRFTYATRGAGKLKGVDVFRDLMHESPKQPAHRIFEGYAIGASWTYLASGRLVMTFHAAVPERAQQAGHGSRPVLGIFDVHVMYSDDDGATWTMSPARLSVPAAPAGTNYGAVEPSLFPLRDGRLSMLIRTQVGRLYESSSSDRGETWTTATPTPLISSDSPAERVRLPDGRTVLFLNACQHWDDPHGYAHGGRYVLHAAVSADDGQTWRGFREVVRARQTGYAKGDHGTAYPRAAATADGHVLLGTGQAKENLALLRIDPDWLEAQSSADDFSQGLDAWHITPSAQLVDAADGRVLGLGDAAEAAWNFPAGRSGVLTLRVTATEQWKGGMISLTDHFSPLGDNAADQHALLSLRLPDTRLELSSGEAAELRIEWDAAAEQATAAVNGRSVAIPLRRSDTLGASYLRLKSESAAGEKGLLIHSVRVEVR